jgi:hypothetical protein
MLRNRMIWFLSIINNFIFVITYILIKLYDRLMINERIIVICSIKYRKFRLPAEGFLLLKQIVTKEIFVLAT